MNKQGFPWRAASNVGTALNSGEGGILPEELDKAGKYILQFSKTEWSKEEDVIKHADMIEIKLGQGAFSGMGWKIPYKAISNRATKILGLKDNEDAVIFNSLYRGNKNSLKSNGKTFIERIVKKGLSVL